MNIQWSSRTDKWYTPPYILDKVRATLRGIELDPASSLKANQYVQAERIYTEKDDGLTQSWRARTIFVNPPGGKKGNLSNTVLFWTKLMQSRTEFKSAIFMAFSLEALQTTQKPATGLPSLGEFPICIPSKRLAFYTPEGVPGKAPSHSNCIALVTKDVSARFRFLEQFQDVGVILNA